MSSTASELEAESIPRKESGDGQGSVKRRVVNSPALDEGGMEFSLARNVFKGAASNVNLEQLDMLDSIGLK